MTRLKRILSDPVIVFSVGAAAVAIAYGFASGRVGESWTMLYMAFGFGVGRVMIVAERKDPVDHKEETVDWKEEHASKEEP